jgi:ATP-dependent Clp protease ATP-binding subunit ClpC
VSRRALRVYFVEDAGGLLTGHLVARSNTYEEYVASGATEDDILAQLDALLQRDGGDPLERTEPFSWTEELHVDQVVVEIRPQTQLGKRLVIGKQRIPITLTYAWAALEGERADGVPSGFRVMLPRFGLSFVLEDLRMAAEVLRQAVGSALAGEAARSLFEFREVAREYVLPWFPKWRAGKHRRDAHRDEFPTLQAVAEEWSELGRSGKLGNHFGPVDETRYTKLLTARQKPSLLLVGPSGVGKTEWVRELARRAGRPREDLDESTKVWASSADRIMAGQTYLGMWEQRCLDLCYELSGEGDYLFVDRLSDFVRARTGASSIADLFETALSEGSVSLIAECTVEEHERLQASHSSLLSNFQVVRLVPPSVEEVCALVDEHQQRSPSRFEFSSEAIRRLVRHLALFRKSSAFPGKALMFLDWLTKVEAPRSLAATGSAAHKRLTPREVDRLFAQYSGLAEQLISDSEHASASVIAEALKRRVVGQALACERAGELLARFKAGVNDPEKPLGSLLFVGPTGVGKTELAKELARYLFGSPDRMVRLDMSELMLSSSTARLLADERGAASLVQRISQEPLSLILLDEIEKAHPAVFDVLLGMLGEGRLTSSSGRLVDFRMTLVIMTSNLGSGVAKVGFGAQGGDAQSLESAVRAHFRPEFFNRLDHVVPFSALSAEALRNIVDLSLSELSEREGLKRRNLRLMVNDEARALLAALGSNAEYGARPLKRVLEEKIVTPVATELAVRPNTRDARVVVTVVEGALRVEIVR